MKTRPTLAIILGSAALGAGIAALSNASFLAQTSGEVLMAIAASTALLGFAVRDYAREFKPLAPRAPVLRLPLPQLSADPYSVRRQSAIVERIAG